MATDEQATVVVVDDEAALAEVYATFLEEDPKRDWETRVATSGEEALELVDETVDVVLLDRRMPDLPGGEVLDRLRDRGYDVPVGMLTAVEPDFDIVEMGFDGYLQKPVDGDGLREFVAALRHRGAYDETIREYFAVVTKITTLEAEKLDSELDASEEYAELLDRLETVKDDARAALDEAIQADEFDELLGDLDTDEDD